MADDVIEGAEEESGKGLKLRLVLAVIVVGALGVFVAQNTADAEVNFLWMDGSLPLFLLILITGALFWVLTVVTTWILRRRNQ